MCPCGACPCVRRWQSERRAEEEREKTAMHSRFFKATVERTLPCPHGVATSGEECRAKKNEVNVLHLTMEGEQVKERATLVVDGVERNARERRMLQTHGTTVGAST